MATRIKHVKGNVLRVQIPLTIQRVSMDEGTVVSVEEDFYPSPLYPVYINFKSTLKRSFEGAIDGNVVSMRDQGTLNVGTYQIEVLCSDNDGNPYRYMVRDIIEIVDATADAGIVAGIEFDAEVYTLDGAVFIGFVQEQTDWAEQDNTKVSYLKNKPVLAQVATSGDYGDLQNTPAVPERLSELMDDELHRTVTDTEKAAWNAKQEAIADLGDIRAGAAAGATALQSESDPTVPAWAKQPTKPSYNYSEIGNTPDLSGFITKSVDDLVNYYLKSETYTKAEVEALIAAINQFHYEIYASLGDIVSPASNVLYLIGPTGTGSDQYEEYVYVTNVFVKIGDTSISLDGYVTTSDLEEALSAYTTSEDLATLLEGYVTTAAMETALSSKADVATTLAGYGITDAKIESGTITLGSDSITPLTSHQDISGKADKDTDAVEGNFAAFDSSGNPVDSGHKHSDYITSHQDISGKADKVTGATNGNFAALDSNGNLTDSGHKHSDYLTSHQDISGKADKDLDAVSGNFAAFDSSGNPVDSGHKHSDYLTQHQDISGKADKVTSATNGNFASLDSNGNLTDSGHKHSDYLTSHQSVTDSDPTLAWNTRSKVATVGATDIHVTLPANPNPVPAPAATDNGKVLSVTDAQGTIAWTTPTGGGDVTDVTLGGSSVVDGDGVAVLPAYPTTLPASDVSAWAKASTKPSYDYSEIGNTPNLATVATSGSYNDLSNQPTIPDLTDYTDTELQTAIDTAFANL